MSVYTQICEPQYLGIHFKIAMETKHTKEKETNRIKNKVNYLANRF